MNPRGRPSTGIRVDIRIPADILAVIDRVAERRGETRAVIIRETLDEMWGQWTDDVATGDPIILVPA